MAAKRNNISVFKQNYEAVIKRGLIKPETTDRDFCRKADEELREVHQALYSLETDKENNLDEEITDLMNACSNWLIHRGKDPTEELEKVLIKNQKRAENNS